MANLEFPLEMSEQPNSPQIIISGGYREVTRVYTIPHALTQDQLIIDGYVPEDDIEAFDYEYTRAKYLGYEIEPSIGFDVFKRKFKERIVAKGTYEITQNTAETPLDLCTGFLMNWKYQLWCTPDTTAVPNWWSTAVNKTDTLNQTTYEWAESNPGGERTKLLKDKQKPGNESYLKPILFVTKKKVYPIENLIAGTISSAGKWLYMNGKRCKPYIARPEFNFFSGDYDNSYYWIIRDVRIVEDDDRLSHAVTVEFLFSGFDKQWSVDIYPACDAQYFDEGP